MKAMPAAPTMTAEEFLEHPPFQGRRGLQLVAGEVVVNEPTFLHWAVQNKLFSALAEWIRAGDRRGYANGPADVRLDTGHVLVPDVLWYSAERAPDIRAQPPYPMPDLAVEVRSPSTWSIDIGAKKSAYERHGLSELWLVDTVEPGQVLVFRRSSPAAVVFDLSFDLDPGDELTSPLLPDFAVAVAGVFDV